MGARPLYCHFGFRKPEGKDYCLFSCACYLDKEGKKLVSMNVEMHKLWLDNQHITAVQSYWFALKCLYDWQEKIENAGFTNVLLVCNNRNLVNTITVKKKSTLSSVYLKEVYKHYISGDKVFNIPIGICEARKSEKSRKYCQDKYVTNKDTYKVDSSDEIMTKLSLSDDMDLLSVDDIIESDTTGKSGVVSIDWSV